MRNTITTKNGLEYEFSIEISEDVQKGDDKAVGRPASLDIENVEMFNYENKANCFVPGGYILYRDKAGLIDKYSAYEFVRIEVAITQFMTEGEGKTKTIIYQKPTVKFKLLLDNIEITEYKPNEILYKLHFLGYNILNLRKTCVYSSYPEGELVTNSIKELLDKSGLITDGQSFLDNCSDVRIKHISNGTDDILNTLRYLQRRQFFGDKYDTNLKMISYNDRDDKYELFTPTDMGKWKSSFYANIDMIKNGGNTSQLTDGPQYIAMVANKSNSQAIASYSPRRICTYDIEKDAFGTIDYGSREIMNINNPNVENRNKHPIINESLYQIHQSTWNNDVNIYAEQIDNMIDNYGIKVNVCGMLGIVPGDIMGLNINKSENPSSFENSDISKFCKDKFRSFEGKWTVSRVVYQINARQCIFRSNISLMRGNTEDVLRT